MRLTLVEQTAGPRGAGSGRNTSTAAKASAPKRYPPG